VYYFLFLQEQIKGFIYNVTHNVTCKACQANSWSYAGTTLLEPCLCNAGYELQGGLCVACPVGKARQANHNNSIVCETCASGTFTSVSASITCHSCEHDCSDNTLPPVVIADFTGIASIEQKNTVGDIQWPAGSKSAWNDYAARIGAKTEGVSRKAGVVCMVTWLPSNSSFLLIIIGSTSLYLRWMCKREMDRLVSFCP
jgi:hypothetical protein